jgi:hypothetical protein
MADPKGVPERESYIIVIRLEQSKPRGLRRWSDEAGQFLRPD